MRFLIIMAMVGIVSDFIISPEEKKVNGIEVSARCADRSIKWQA